MLASKTEIEMWGDGLQTRSFTFIDDCVEGILRITKSDCRCASGLVGGGAWLVAGRGERGRRAEGGSLAAASRALAACSSLRYG